MQPVSVFKQTDDKVVYYRVRYSAVDKSSNVQWIAYHLRLGHLGDQPESTCRRVHMLNFAMVFWRRTHVIYPARGHKVILKRWLT